MITSEFKSTAAKIVAVATASIFAASLLVTAAPAHATSLYAREVQQFAKFPKTHNATEYVDETAVGSTQNGTLANPFLTISAALATLNASTSQATSTIEVAAGTYNEDLTIPQKNLTLQGAGAGETIINSDGSSANGIMVNGQNNFLMDGFTTNVSPTDGKILFALNAYESYNLTLSDDTFNGLPTNTSGGLIDGVQINNSTKSTLSNDTVQGFGQDGVAIISKFLVANPNNTHFTTFNNDNIDNNSTDGIAFYTVATDQGGTGQHRMTGVTFTGSNMLQGNGNGLFIEGDTNANYIARATPRFIVVSNPPQKGPITDPLLDINHLNFSGNANEDIINYQTAPVNAISSTFNGLTGTQMTDFQRQHEESKIFDQRGLPSLGLVTFF